MGSEEEWPELESSFKNRRQRKRDEQKLLSAKYKGDSDSSGAEYESSDDDGGSKRKIKKLKRNDGKEKKEDENESENEDMFNVFVLKDGEHNEAEEKERDEEEDENDSDAGYDDRGEGLVEEYIKDKRERKKLKTIHNSSNHEKENAYYDDDDDEENEDNDENPPISVTAFNMKDELESGKIEDGIYIESKDKDEIHDTWLLDTKQTKSNLKKIQLQKERLNQRIKENEEKWDNRKVSRYNKNECFLEILRLLKVGETIPDALRRMSGISSLSKKDKKKNKKDKKNKKNANLEKDTQGINALTELADRLVSDFNEIDVYTQRYESIVRKLRIDGKLPEDWINGDPIPDNNEQNDSNIQLFDI